MRQILFYAICMVLMAWLSNPARAELPDPKTFQISIQESYRTAKNAKEIESITAYCTDVIKGYNFKQHDRAMRLAIDEMENNKIDEANAHLKEANALDDQSSLLAKLICKPSR